MILRKWYSHLSLAHYLHFKTISYDITYVHVYDLLGDFNWFHFNHFYIGEESTMLSVYGPSASEPVGQSVSAFLTATKEKQLICAELEELIC